MRIPRVIACAWLATAGAACGYHDYPFPTGPTEVVVVASRQVITEPRPVGTFTAITVSTAIRVVVVVGGTESLDITAEDNVVPLVDASVTGGRLSIGFRPGTSIQSSAGVVCRVGVRSLQGVDLSGASQIQVDGLDARDFSVDVAGASSFIGTGVVDRLRMNISGASRVTAPSLRARDVDVTISGVSTALVRVVNSLVARASGASLFEYFGDPAVQAEVSGQSTVRRAGP